MPPNRDRRLPPPPTASEKGARPERTPKQTINDILVNDLADFFCRRQKKPDIFRSPKLSQPGSRARMELVERINQMLDFLIDRGKGLIERTGGLNASFAAIEQLTETQRSALIGELIDKIARGEYNDIIEKHIAPQPKKPSR